MEMLATNVLCAFSSVAFLTPLNFFLNLKCSCRICLTLKPCLSKGVPIEVQLPSLTAENVICKIVGGPRYWLGIVFIFTIFAILASTVLLLPFTGDQHRPWTQLIWNSFLNRQGSCLVKQVLCRCISPLCEFHVFTCTFGEVLVIVNAEPQFIWSPYSLNAGLSVR